MKFTQGQDVSRRNLVGGIAAALGLIGFYSVKYWIESGHSLDDFLPNEEINVLKTRKKVVSRTHGEMTIPTAYIEFRGSVFELYPINLVYFKVADRKDTEPLSLVERVHIMYNPGVPLPTSIHLNATRLFNYFNHESITLENVIEGQKTSLNFRKLPAAIISENQFYVVPVLLPYKSIDELTASKLVI